LYFFGETDSSLPTTVPGATRPLVVRGYPNPFNPAVKIAYELPRAGHLEIALYDVRGRRVRSLADGPLLAGSGFKIWDGRDDSGKPLHSGVYFCVVRAAEQERILKLALIK